MTSKHRALVGDVVACLKPISITATLGLFATQALASQDQRDLAFPGYSGFLNVPSATVLHHGQASVQWSDQAYLSGRSGFGAGRYGHLNNVAGVFGLFPNMELGGRLVWDKTQTNCFRVGCTIRDLSANLKVQAPLIPREWFTLAGGAQDLGGETGDFEAFYVVAGKQLGPLELTAGYGRPEVPSRYLDGAFGAISYRPAPWVNIIAEHDSQDVRLGLGLSTPDDWLPHRLQIKGKVLAWDNIDEGDTRNFVSIGLSMPFGNAGSRPHAAQASARTGAKAQAVAEVAPKTRTETDPDTGPRTSVASETKVSPPPRESNQAIAARIGQKLVDAGYDNVRTAGHGDTLKVWWENNLYNRDERVSIDDVAHRVRQEGGAFERTELTLLNQGLPVLTQTIGPDGRMLPGETGLAESSLFNMDQTEWDFRGSYAPHWRPRLTLSPAITSGVATEYGVLDTSVALKSELDFNLWPGALAGARYDVEVYETDDFDRGGIFFDSRQKTALVEAEVQQTFKLHSQLYTSFHAGRYAIDYDGVINETLLLSPGARHGISFLGGSFQHKDNDDIARNQMLARYSYYNPSLDVQLAVHAGQFFEEDTGVRVGGLFWFGDYGITLQYRNTDAEFVGLGWLIPLTPVKDHQWRYLQVKGDANWGYSLQTRINEDANNVSFRGARIINSMNPLQETYLNRGRIAR
ncbi:MAG: YjbH domain-containing protein [Oleiphilaceae bacterium]|nr:YjbH domain-containing protein [Oleiphilaceae bacterium]